MNKIFASLAVMMFLGGCQSLSQPGSRPPAKEALAPSPAPASPPPPQPVGSFREDTLYSLLVGELAGQRNRFDIALEN